MKWKQAFALSAVAFTTSTAVAFFPPIPTPGEVVTVVPPTPPDPVIVPPTPPVIHPPHGPVEKPTCTCDPGTPQGVPEPATIIATLTGLAAAGGWKLRKRG